MMVRADIVELLESVSNDEADEDDPAAPGFNLPAHTGRKAGGDRGVRRKRKNDRPANLGRVGENRHPHLLAKADEWLRTERENTGEHVHHEMIVKDGIAQQRGKFTGRR